MFRPSLVLDKTKVEVLDSFENAELRDRAYWLSKTPLEWLPACELLRQLNYGYDPATAPTSSIF